MMLLERAQEVRRRVRREAARANPLTDSGERTNQIWNFRNEANLPAEPAADRAEQATRAPPSAVIPSAELPRRFAILRLDGGAGEGGFWREYHSAAGDFPWMT